jgi:hypothetical protein
MAAILLGEAFGVEDALIPDPGVVLHAQPDDVDRQLVGFGMKLLGHVARRAATSLLAVGQNHDETRLVAGVERIGRLLDGGGERRPELAAFGEGLRPSWMVHWFQAPEP